MWQLRDFEYHADIWINTENPDQILINEVFEWILSRMEDPYQGVRREPGFDNLWYGPVPQANRQDTTVVASYWIVEGEHVVRCNSIATLNRPA